MPATLYHHPLVFAQGVFFNGYPGRFPGFYIVSFSFLFYCLFCLRIGKDLDMDGAPALAFMLTCLNFLSTFLLFSSTCLYYYIFSFFEIPNPSGHARTPPDHDSLPLLEWTGWTGRASHATTSVTNTGTLLLFCFCFAFYLLATLHSLTHLGLARVVMRVQSLPYCY
jgi:hypothetical protein